MIKSSCFQAPRNALPRLAPWDEYGSGQTFLMIKSSCFQVPRNVLPRPAPWDGYGSGQTFQGQWSVFPKFKDDEEDMIEDGHFFTFFTHS